MSHVRRILSGMSSVGDRHYIGRDVPGKDIVYMLSLTSDSQGFSDYTLWMI